MPAKNTLEHVKSVGLASGLILLDEAYVATDMPMRWQCVKHACSYIWRAPFRLVSWGRDCPACKGKEPWSEAKAASQARANGFELASVDMSTRRATLRCQSGHEMSVGFANLRTCRCAECAALGRREEQMMKLTQYAAEKGAVVLATRIDSLKDPLPMRCSHGHEFEASYSSMIHMGSFCPTCARTIRGKA